jgi:hypothetical protein
MSFQANLETLAYLGLTPYVAASRSVVDALDFSVLGRAPRVHLLEREEDRPFHEAFRLSNALGFGVPEAKMPDWVLVDCVLMQTAIVGFALSRRRASDDLLKAFAADPAIEMEKLDHIPVSGQIAALSLDGQRLVGFSLFSLRRYLPAVPALGVVTKALALLLYRAQGRRFTGISNWDLKSLSMHGKFGRPMWVEWPTIPVRPKSRMFLIYGMVIDFDPDALHEREAPGEYDFMMRADDDAKKREMIKGIGEGKRYIIVPPYQIEKEGGIHIPIRVTAEP